MSAAEKTIAALIDELVTTNIRCYMAQEEITRAGADDPSVARAAREAQRLNARRCDLQRAIDERLGERAAERKSYAT